MAILYPGESRIGVEIRGKLGAPSAYGTRNYGGFNYGAGADVAGIYRVRHRWGKTIQEKLPFYWPTNPKTEPQQAWRAIFSDGVVAWQALSEESKNGYRDLAKSLDITGFNLFMREYLYANK